MLILPVCITRLKNAVRQIKYFNDRSRIRPLHVIKQTNSLYNNNSIVKNYPFYCKINPSLSISRINGIAYSPHSNLFLLRRWSPCVM